jgi:hypothetical protein
MSMHYYATSSSSPVKETPTKRSHASELVFLYGALRSGTTLLKLMLDANQDINCPGEVDFIFDYLNAHPTSGKWTYDLEGLRLDRIFQSYSLNIIESNDAKTIVLDFVNQFRQRGRGSLVLNIHRNLDRLVAIYPDAQIIHLIRDPRDVANSCVRMGWAGNTYYAVNHWLDVENDWNKFGTQFPKDNVIQIFFKCLVSDPVGQLERLCHFLKVSYSADMLDYSMHSTYEKPDPSKAEKWKQSSSREVALVELRAKPLLLERHYELSGYPLDPPNFGERILLWCTNKMNKWKFRWQRYGALIFTMDLITRKLGTRFQPIIRQRMNEIESQYLR